MRFAQRGLSGHVAAPSLESGETKQFQRLMLRQCLFPSQLRADRRLLFLAAG